MQTWRVLTSDAPFRNPFRIVHYHGHLVVLAACWAPRLYQGSQSKQVKLETPGRKRKVRIGRLPILTRFNAFQTERLMIKLKADPSSCDASNPNFSLHKFTPQLSITLGSYVHNNSHRNRLKH
jgi:hypothetical protein